MKKYDLMRLLNIVEGMIIDYTDIDTSKHQFEITFKDRNSIGSYVKPDYSEKKNKYTHKIYMCDNLNFFIKRAKDCSLDNCSSFIQDFCDEEDFIITMYIFTFLHEFGHAYDYIKHIRNDNKYAIINVIFKTSARNTFKNLLKKEYIHKQKYTELIADNFAYTFIEIIYKQLKEKEII